MCRRRRGIDFDLRFKNVNLSICGKRLENGKLELKRTVISQLAEIQTNLDCDCSSGTGKKYHTAVYFQMFTHRLDSEIRKKEARKDDYHLVFLLSLVHKLKTSLTSVIFILYPHCSQPFQCVSVSISI